VNYVILCHGVNVKPKPDKGSSKPVKHPQRFLSSYGKRSCASAGRLSPCRGTLIYKEVGIVSSKGIAIFLIPRTFQAECWGDVVRYPFALRAERNGTNASDVRYPDAADPLYLLYLWTLGRHFLRSHLSPAYPVIPSWTHVMTFLQPRFVVIGTWHVYKPSYISPQSLVK
jgi:hypothetical protein